MRLPEGVPARSDRSAQEGGTTLIELLVGLVIVVSALTPILTMTAQHSQLRRIDTEIGLAFTAAQNNLEEVRSLPLASLPALG